QPYLPTVSAGADGVGTTLTGTLSLQNVTKETFLASRLVVVLLSGRGGLNTGRVAAALIDPEDEKAETIHERHHARAVATVWDGKENTVAIGNLSQDQPFDLIIPAELPPTIHTGRGDKDVSHFLFVALHRSGSPRPVVVHKTELLVRRCVTRFEPETRMMSGLVGQGLISFQAAVPDPYYMGDEKAFVKFQAAPSMHGTTAIVVDHVECVWNEVVSFRNVDRTTTKAERPLTLPIRLEVPENLLATMHVPVPSTVGQPDIDMGEVAISHEACFTVTFFKVNGAVTTKRANVILPVRFVAVAGDPSDEPDAIPAAADATNITTTDPTPTTTTNPSVPHATSTSTSTTTRTPTQKTTITTKTTKTTTTTTTSSPLKSRKTGRTTLRPITINNLTEFRASRPWKPQRSDELVLTVGDVLVIWQIFDDGWCYGRNLTTSN
ncbi:hypothetical protein HK104_007250, partial [Borealophlyctis nickersoniae]